MKTAILAVGTELTDGQIINKNAAWLAKHLKRFGVQCTHHLVVPDDRVLIREALEYCEDKCDLLFVTGGLGPTSDDFTRDLIAQWADQELEFHPPSWEHLEKRLVSRGYKVKDIQRQQCYFPRGSKVLFNSQGTANAFYLETRGKKVFVLPGPPREIEAVWDSDIAPWLAENTTHLDPRITRAWDTIGIGESDMAMIVEEVLQGVDVEKGYRVHLPYVEAKLSFLVSEEAKFAPYVEKITEALKFCLVSRDEEDMAETLAERAGHFGSLSVQDEVSGTFLVNRLLHPFRDLMSTCSWNFGNVADDTDPSDLILRILPVDEHHARVEMICGTQVRWKILEAPYKTVNMADRRRQYFAEMALVTWAQWLG